MIAIDMKMPKCCDECFALDDHGDYPFCLISQDQRGYTFNTKEKRMPTCPLKSQEPMLVEERADTDTINCPKCGQQFAKVGRDKSIYLDADEEPNYCPKCGQAVKWE